MLATSFSIFQRDGWRCVFCGYKGTFLTLVVDHAIPRSRWGTDDPSNLQTTCSGCNAQKGDKTSGEYLIWRALHPLEANFGPF